MTNFWYPYAGQGEVSEKLGLFADHALSPSCGISFSDGQSISVLRLPRATSANSALWLNILREHVAAPPPAPPKSHGVMQKVADWFTQAMTMYGESEMQQAEANLAMSNAIVGTVDEHIWQPAHQWLLKHKLFADGLGVAVDVVGVIAGVAFIITVGPELAVVAGITGGLAAAGSFLLLACDGAVFVTEVSGNEALSKKIEDSKAVQWGRIVGTLMVLPDLPVGGVRALREVGSLAEEARAAREAAVVAEQNAAAQRIRMGRIHNPERHPVPMQRHANRANAYARLALERSREATAAGHRMALVATRDVNASFVATPVGAALIAGSPPSVLMSKEQQEKDEKFLSLLKPEGGMPKDVKLEIRISNVTRSAKK